MYSGRKLAFSQNIDPMKKKHIKKIRAFIKQIKVE